jgi:hypothetical protein
MFDRSILS